MTDLPSTGQERMAKAQRAFNIFREQETTVHAHMSSLIQLRYEVRNMVFSVDQSTATTLRKAEVGT